MAAMDLHELDHQAAAWRRQPGLLLHMAAMYSRMHSSTPLAAAPHLHVLRHLRQGLPEEAAPHGVAQQAAGGHVVARQQAPGKGQRRLRVGADALVAAKEVEAQVSGGLGCGGVGSGGVGLLVEAWEWAEDRAGRRVRDDV